MPDEVNGNVILAAHSGNARISYFRTLDKLNIYNHFKFDAIFIGSDWKGNPRWEQTKEDLNKIGVDVVFLPHTDGVSSTMIREKCNYLKVGKDEK